MLSIGHRLCRGRLNLSEQPWALKYRPSQLSEVVGQERVTSLLQRALELDRVYPVQVLSGPSGVGKTTVARLLAAELSSAPTDVLEIDAASHGSVSDVRELRGLVQFSPVGSARVIIIDEAHMLSRAAFDALLKVMEETPSSVYFILVTTQDYRIPDTVLGRSFHLKFSGLSSEDIKVRLTQIVEQEKFSSLGMEVLDHIALLSAPSVRAAITLLEELHIRGGMTLDQFLAMYGDGYVGFKVLAACSLGKLETALELVRQHSELYGGQWVCSVVAKALVDVSRVQAGAVDAVGPATVSMALGLASSVDASTVLDLLKLVWSSLNRVQDQELAQVVTVMMSHLMHK